MARKNLNWNGPAVSAKMKAAQIAGVNETMAATTVQAKRNHDWENQTGVLEGGVNVITFARDVAEGVKGVWGVQDVKYALSHELGAVITPKSAKALAIPQDDGGVAFVQSVTIPARPFLRPAADEIYPSLAGRIKRSYERAA